MYEITEDEEEWEAAGGRIVGGDFAFAFTDDEEEEEVVGSDDWREVNEEGAIDATVVAAS